MKKDERLSSVPTGWAGLATAFTPAHKQEAQSLTMCSAGSDIPRPACGLKHLRCSASPSAPHARTGRNKKRKLFPWCVFWVCVRVFVRVLVAREDVDIGITPIRIKADNVGGQRRALWVEIALPLLRKNIDVDKWQ